MRWAIPEFRLPSEVLDRELAFLKTRGIDFEGNRTLGQDLDLVKLEREYHAVLLALGAHDQTRLGVPGEKAQGILFSLDFMKSVRRKPPDWKKLWSWEEECRRGRAQTALRLGPEGASGHLERGRNARLPLECRRSRGRGRNQNGWGPMRFRVTEEIDRCRVQEMPGRL
jgi:hypothetical protein